MQKPVPQILYIHPSKQGVDFDPGKSPMGRPYGLIPVGVIALANLLEENGLEVCGLNYPLERVLNRQFSLREWLRGQHQARLVMIDLHWYEHCYGAIHTAKVHEGTIGYYGHHGSGNTSLRPQRRLSDL